MLRRYTYLKRSGKPLKRTWLKRVSAKKRKVDSAYNPRAKEWKEEHPECKALISPYCTGVTDDVHHMNKRGIHILDESTWLPTCRQCHNFIHDNPGIARAKGLLE